MEKKHFLKKFENQSAYESQKDSVMAMPHVVLFADTKEVVYASYEIDYSKEFFTIEALEEGTVGIGIPSSATSLKYRKNSEPWVETSEAIQLSVVANDTIQISCVGDYFNDECSSVFAISIPFNVKGNIMSLVYGDNFEGQTDLSGKNNILQNTFYNCTTLQNAKNLILPATTLEINCYISMFQGCSSLTEAPALPATTLAIYCYSGMFNGCTSLTSAPELPATTLADYCYANMFQGCSKLNYIKMLATDIRATECLSYWVVGVAISGTFVKNSALLTLQSGGDGIPDRWTVENV